MKLSARNQLQGKVRSVTIGAVMAEIVVELGAGQEIVADISKVSARRLKLKRGDAVTAIVKASAVMIGK
jgi:molybdopterin-binding protein